MAEAELGIHGEHEMHGGHEGHGGHEIHGEHAPTRFAKMVGVTVSVIGVILAVVTIASHRAHTAAVIHRTEANDEWSYYQAKRTREYMADVASSLITTLAKDPADVRERVARYSKDHDHYQKDADSIQREAEARGKECEREETRALRLDISEGFFELGLVLSSLYFLARRRFFPFLGALSALIGAGFGIVGFMS